MKNILIIMAKVNTKLIKASFQGSVAHMPCIRGLQVSSKMMDAILSDPLFICEFLTIFLVFGQGYVY